MVGLSGSFGAAARLLDRGVHADVRVSVWSRLYGCPPIGEFIPRQTDGFCHFPFCLIRTIRLYCRPFLSRALARQTILSTSDRQRHRFQHRRRETWAFIAPPTPVARLHVVLIVKQSEVESVGISAITDAACWIFAHIRNHLGIAVKYDAVRATPPASAVLWCCSGFHISSSEWCNGFAGHHE